MAGLPKTLTFHEGGATFQLIHGGVDVVNRFVFASDHDRIAAELARADADVIVAGHCGLPFIEMARLKGLRQSRIVLRHALPNAAGPIANAAALSLSALLGGVIIVEVVFDYPGLAKLMVDAVATRDMPLIQACAMVFCAGYMALGLIADLFSILTNPRLAHS